jgi:hypothetical protein
VLFFNQLNCQNIFKINLCRLWRSRITKGGATVVCQAFQINPIVNFVKQQGFTTAILMSDDEREKIGACYKNKGQAKAIELGHELVQGDVKNKRIEAWLQFIKNNPNGAL